MIRSLQVLLLFLQFHFIPCLDEHGPAWITAEYFSVVGEKAPEESVPDGLPISFREVAHFHEVVGTADIGFAGHHTSIAVLRHTIYIRNHYPVIGIDVEFHEPLVDGIGMNLTEQHEVAEYHETFDVVVVARAKQFPDGEVDGWNAGGSGIEGVGHGMGKAPKVFAALAAAGFLVNELNEFAPAQYLPNDALDAVQGNGMGVGIIDEPMDDLHGLKEADVE